MGRLFYPLGGAIVGYLLAVLTAVLVFEFVLGAKGLGLLGAALLCYVVFGPVGLVAGIVIGYRLWSRRRMASLLRDSDQGD